MLDWCSVDPRLLAVTVVPVGDMPAAAALTREAIDGGTGAIQIGQYCTPHHSPSHVALDPVWSMCEEAGVPVLLHVAGAGEHVMPPAYFENGGPPVPDFHGGDTNFKSIDYMSIPLPVMQTLNALVIDGVLQSHPDLRVGVIELGASWVPGWMRMLDSAHEAFRKNEERLQRMDGKPSEYVRRQIRATPYPHEDTGWTIANCWSRRVPLLVRLPACRGRPEPDRTLRTQHGRGGHRRRHSPALLRRQLRRSHAPRARTTRSADARVSAWLDLF